jgi:3-oxoacyl-[acyl-carrier protein] reductase
MLANKTIIITGASRGIGRAIATACAREGARVGINYFQNKEQADELAAELARSYGVEALPLQFDVGDAAAIARACQSFIEAQGRIDGWINNAGINLPGLLLSQTDEMVQAQLATNLLGPIYCCRFVIPYMMAQRGGVIINIGSITSTRVAAGQAVYAATKGALASLTRALAHEYGRKGIRVNCLEPGPVETDMLKQTMALASERIVNQTALKRLGSAAEIAEFVTFLLSDRASFLTGGIFAADGGYSIA